jgi:predicted nucleic acid-binding protein
VLVDTSVWVDHLRHGNDLLARRLRDGRVWAHPFVIGELACGSLRGRREILSRLATLPQAPVVDHGEALAFLESQRLFAHGLGWIDVHLLAAARLAGIRLWSFDRRLASVARSLRMATDLS